MKYDSETLEDWIIRCQEEGNLSRWENDFVTSVYDQLSRTGFLTEKQIDALERIYTDKVP